MSPKTIALGLAALAVAGSASAAVTITVENPGVTSTSANGTFSVETFDASTQGFVTSFTDVIGGVTFNYAGVDVRPADIYGGVGGTQYAATYNGLNFPPYSASQGTYTLAVTSPSLINYFGAYFTAQDFNNSISFYKGATLLTTFTPAAVLLALPGFGNYTDSNGLTNVFVNIYFTGADSYDNVVFSAAGTGTGFESDNQTVGRFVPPITGNLVSGVVPETSTWVMLIAGFGLVGVTARRRRSTTVAA